MPRVRAVKKQVVSEMPGQDEENPDPQRQVQDTVVGFVFFALDDSLHE
jgi:hypothetical protein